MRRPDLSPKEWQCPDCGRRFVQRTREHSCDVTSVEKHLAKTSPEVRATFAAFQSALASLGPYTLTPLKTMITISVKSNFGGLTFTRARIDLGFFLMRQIDNPRIRRIERISPRKLAHHVHLHSPEDVDSELLGWLREAYGAAAGGPPVITKRPSPPVK